MLDLKGIRERLERATPGEWINDGAGDGNSNHEVYSESVRKEAKQFEYNGFVASVGQFVNAEFIAHSKSDITSLLSEVDSLRETLRVAEEALRLSAGRVIDPDDETKELLPSKAPSWPILKAREALSKIKTQLEGEATHADREE